MKSLLRELDRTDSNSLIVVGIICPHMLVNDIHNLVLVVPAPHNTVRVHGSATGESINGVLSCKGATNEVEDVGHNAKDDHFGDVLDLKIRKGVSVSQGEACLVRARVLGSDCHNSFGEHNRTFTTGVFNFLYIRVCIPGVTITTKASLAS